MNFVILFADNDNSYLDTQAEFLELLGYRVEKAYTLDDAFEKLSKEYIHLAILDIRMVDEDDEKDESGLTLAKDTTFSAIPKIILTDHPSHKHVPEVLAPVMDGLPPAVHYLSKEEGEERLIQVVDTVIHKYLRINQKLSFRPDEFGLLRFFSVR